MQSEDFVKKRLFFSSFTLAKSFENCCHGRLTYICGTTDAEVLH